jgi:hypothetical protein
MRPFDAKMSLAQPGCPISDLPGPSTPVSKGHPITWLLTATPITFGHTGCAGLISASKGQANHFWGTTAVPYSFWRHRAASISFGSSRLCQTPKGQANHGCAILILALESQADRFWGTLVVSNLFWRRRAALISYGPLWHSIRRSSESSKKQTSHPKNSTVKKES